MNAFPRTLLPGALALCLAAGGAHAASIEPPRAIPMAAFAAIEQSSEPIPWSYTATVLVLAEDGVPEWFGPIRGCIAGRSRAEAEASARQHATIQVSPFRRVLAVEILVIDALPR